MREFFKIEEDAGLFRTVLPPFDSADWPRVVGTSGFVWIRNPFVELSGKLDSVVSQAFFGATDVDLRCSIHRLELDISIPTIEFLRFTTSLFTHGLDFIRSEKHQPMGFQLASISKSRWPQVIAQNQIKFMFHRPDGGEPSVLTAATRESLSAIISTLTHR